MKQKFTVKLGLSFVCCLTVKSWFSAPEMAAIRLEISQQKSEDLYLLAVDY